VVAIWWGPFLARLANDDADVRRLSDPPIGGGFQHWSRRGTGRSATCQVELNHDVGGGQESSVTSWTKPSHYGTSHYGLARTVLGDYCLEVRLEADREGVHGITGGLATLWAARQAANAPSVAPTPPTAVNVAVTFSHVVTSAIRCNPMPWHVRARRQY
jgi:hypothetical protein